MNTSKTRPKRVFREREGRKAFRSLRGKVCAVIGYGSQGHAHAQNLKDSGCNVIIGLYEGSPSWKKAEEDGFQVYKVSHAVSRASVILVAIPDMKQAAVYEQEIAPNLTRNTTLLFSHGLSIHFGLITVPKHIKVAMVAPKGPGHLVRSQYVEGKGVPSLIAVAQGGRTAREIALAWAHGIGATLAGVLETTFKEETETDLFGEQSVLCGGVVALMQAGFETLVEAGYAPEMAYFECIHELKLICDLVYKSGISGMRFSISETAKYGDVTRGPVVIDASVKERMKEVLKDIQSGSFVREWVSEYRDGLPNYKRLLKEGAQHPVERVGARLRSFMPWMPRSNIKGVQAAFSG